jgi:hypothetical protein
VRRRAAAALAAALAAAGCSSAGTSGPPRTAPDDTPPSGTGYFVGTGPGGVGATLDLLGEDPVTDAIDAALRVNADPRLEIPAVGIASVVDGGRVGIPAPRFVAELADGTAVPLPRAADVLRPQDGPEARRALALLRRVPVRVKAGGAATLYVVLRGPTPAEVASARMVVVRGEPIALAARRR